jgi:hypothetical protein
MCLGNRGLHSANIGQHLVTISLLICHGKTSVHSPAPVSNSNVKHIVSSPVKLAKHSNSSINPLLQYCGCKMSSQAVAKASQAGSRMGVAKVRFPRYSKPTPLTSQPNCAAYSRSRLEIHSPIHRNLGINPSFLRRRPNPLERHPSQPPIP